MQHDIFKSIFNKSTLTIGRWLRTLKSFRRYCENSQPLTLTSRLGIVLVFLTL